MIRREWAEDSRRMETERNRRGECYIYRNGKEQERVGGNTEELEGVAVESRWEQKGIGRTGP
jgi:hypothetical protein